jgi:uncharacterized membrane protein YqiK
MPEASSAPRWFAVLVVVALIAGIALAFWFYGILTVPAPPS